MGQQAYDSKLGQQAYDNKRGDGKRKWMKFAKAVAIGPVFW